MGGLVTRLSLGLKGTRGVMVPLFVLMLVNCVALNELEAIDGGCSTVFGRVYSMVILNSFALPSMASGHQAQA